MDFLTGNFRLSRIFFGARLCGLIVRRAEDDILLYWRELMRRVRGGENIGINEKVREIGNSLDDPVKRITPRKKALRRSFHQRAP